MKINSVGSPDAIAKYKLNSINNKHKNIPDQGADKLELSDEALSLLPALKLIKQSGDVRQDRVSALKDKIDNGSYNVDSSDVADSIIKGANINIKA